MLTVAYLANEFPSAVEPYVAEEIEELRRRGVRVVAGSVRRPASDEAAAPRGLPEIVVWPVSGIVQLRALGLCFRRARCILPLMSRVLFHGREGFLKRLKAVAHTWLGACYSVLLERSGVEHIHVHHGYLGSWIAMVAARLLGVNYSMTLHGSDLLLHATYLDVKLAECAFCLTVSEYNRNWILGRYPKINAEKVVVGRLGVEVLEPTTEVVAEPKRNRTLSLLSVGRLQAVKDHAFLVRACARLQQSAVPFECVIAGDGPEWHKLECLIRECGLQGKVTLLGHVVRENMNSWYDRADVVVLTSRSEGIPLVLMEAMARRKIVLAPAITGIPELVIADRTGFLYEAGALDDFVARLLFIRSCMQADDAHLPSPSYDISWDGPLDQIRAGLVPPNQIRLEQIRLAAQAQIRDNFNRSRRLQLFGDSFLQRVCPTTESLPHEDFVLQQI